LNPSSNFFSYFFHSDFLSTYPVIIWVRVKV
jgi:hypothetical protein